MLGFGFQVTSTNMQTVKDLWQVCWVNEMLGFGFQVTITNMYCFWPGSAYACKLSRRMSLSSVLSWILQCGHSTSSCTCILILQFHCVITVLQLPEYCIHNSKHCTQIISTFQTIPTVTCLLSWTISTPHIRHCTDVYSHLGFHGDALACPVQWLKFPVLVYCFIPITKKIYCYEFSADRIQVSANRMIRQVWRTIILQYHTLQKYSSSQANCWCCWLQLIPNTSAHTHLLNPEFFITILNFDANSWDYKGIPSTLFLTLGWVPGSCYPSTKNAWIETI